MKKCPDVQTSFLALAKAFKLFRFHPASQFPCSHPPLLLHHVCVFKHKQWLKRLEDWLCWSSPKRYLLFCIDTTTYADIVILYSMHWELNRLKSSDGTCSALCSVLVGRKYIWTCPGIIITRRWQLWLKHNVSGPFSVIPLTYLLTAVFDFDPWCKQLSSTDESV